MTTNLSLNIILNVGFWIRVRMWVLIDMIPNVGQNLIVNVGFQDDYESGPKYDYECEAEFFRMFSFSRIPQPPWIFSMSLFRESPGTPEFSNVPLVANFPVPQNFSNVQFFRISLLFQISGYARISHMSFFCFLNITFFRDSSVSLFFQMFCYFWIS